MLTQFNPTLKKLIKALVETGNHGTAMHICQRIGWYQVCHPENVPPENRTSSPPLNAPPEFLRERYEVRQSLTYGNSEYLGTSAEDIARELGLSLDNVREMELAPYTRPLSAVVGSLDLIAYSYDLAPGVTHHIRQKNGHEFQLGELLRQTQLNLRQLMNALILTGDASAASAVCQMMKRWLVQQDH